MIKILLCCGGGFSSSAIATRMEKEIKEKNLEDKYSIEFLPFGLGLKELDRFDVVILCPHLKVELDRALKNQTIDNCQHGIRRKQPASSFLFLFSFLSLSFPFVKIRFFLLLL